MGRILRFELPQVRSTVACPHLGDQEEENRVLVVDSIADVLTSYLGEDIVSSRN